MSLRFQRLLLLANSSQATGLGNTVAKEAGSCITISKMLRLIGQQRLSDSPATGRTMSYIQLFRHLLQQRADHNLTCRSRQECLGTRTVRSHCRHCSNASRPKKAPLSNGVVEAGAGILEAVSVETAAAGMAVVAEELPKAGAANVLGPITQSASGWYIGRRKPLFGWESLDGWKCRMKRFLLPI